MADQTQLNRLFQTAGTQKQQTGTGYTNLNRLFQANTGSNLGQKVAGNLQKQVGGVQSQLNEQQKAFGEETEKNKVGGAEDVAKRDEVIGRFTSPTAAGGALGDQDVSAFEKYRSGQYAGPQGLKDAGALQNTAAQLKGQSSNLSPSGTQELLRRSVGGNRYTQGQQKLDTMLMGRDPGVQQSLLQSQRQASALGQNIQRANLAASGQAELNKNLAQRFGQETQDKLTSGLSNIDTAITGAGGPLEIALAKEQARKDAITNIANLSTGTKNKLDDNGKPIVDLITGKYVQDVSTTPQVDRISAIQKQLAEAGGDSNIINQLFGKDSASTLSAQSRSRDTLLPQRDLIVKRLIDSEIAGGEDPEYAVEKANQYFDEFANNDTRSMRQHGERIQGVLLNDPNLVGGYQDYLTSKVGRAQASGGLDNFLKTLNASLQSRSTSQEGNAEGLTAAGLASEQQRTNYEALNKLLGKTASESKYRTSDPTKYREGRLLLDPNQIG